MMTKIKTLFLLVLIGVLACNVKTQQQKSPTDINFEQLPLKKLSDYGFYLGKMNALQPNGGVVLYEPIATLFTDYAFKKRFVWMPKGAAATFDVSKPDAALDFPDKTILIKNFYYPTDFSKPEGDRRIIETRLLVKDKGVWSAYPYRWNDEQTDADYKVTGETIPVTWKDTKGEVHKIDYAMPNKNQCKSCHNQKDVFVPIGPKVKQFNYAIQYDYENKITENQLQHWQKLGYLKSTDGIDKIASLVNYNDTHASLNDRARSYLDVNCGHCHNHDGPASTSGLYLNIEEKDPFHWGVFKSPVAAGIGAGSFKFDVNPGKGKESIATFRMNSVHPGIMMPEIGRVSIHTEGVALIEEWINSLK